MGHLGWEKSPESDEGIAYRWDKFQEVWGKASDGIPVSLHR